MKKILISFLIGLSCRAGFCDTKISAMPSTTTLNSADIIPIVANPSGSATNMSITKSNLISTLGIGAGGSSSLEVMANSVRVSSPTATLSLIAGTNVTLSGSNIGGTTAQITINATGGGGSLTLPPTSIPFGSYTSTAATDVNNLNYSSTTMVLSSPYFNAATAYQVNGTSYLSNPSLGTVLVGPTGNTSVTGINNTLIGNAAGQLLTSGQENVMLGNNAGAATKTGGSNTFVGHYAGALSTQTLAVTAIGFNSCTGLVGSSANKGIGEVCVGDEAGHGLTTGEQNTLIGEQAGYILASGSNNTMVGYNAGVTSADNSNNTFLGNSAAYGVTSGSNNTCLGLSACQYLTTASSNVAVGYQTTIGNGGLVTLIGAGANTNAQSPLNSTAIGASASVEVSNTMQLGNNVNVRMSSMTLLNSGGIRFTQDGSYQTISATKIMPISVDNSALVASEQSGNYSLSITVGSGSLPILIFHHECVSAVTSYSVKDGAKSMTTDPSNTTAAGDFYIVNPALGSHTINVTTDCTQDVGGAFSLFGVDQNAPFDQSALGSGTNNLSTSITTSLYNTYVTDLLYSGWIHPQSISGGTGQNVLNTNSAGNDGWGIGYVGVNTSSGSITSNWNTNGGSFARQTMASWKPATIVYAPQLKKSQFVVTDVSSNPVSFDLYNSSPTWYGQHTFNAQMFISSSIWAGGTGNNGQVLTSGGSGSAPSWTTISAGGGGASSLATGVGGPSGYSVKYSSPTSDVIFDSNTFVGALSGTSTGYYKLNTSSVTLQGQNVINLTSTLQSGSTFYVSSGTVSGKFTAGTIAGGSGGITSVGTIGSSAQFFDGDEILIENAGTQTIDILPGVVSGNDTVSLNTFAVNVSSVDFGGVGGVLDITRKGMFSGSPYNTSVGMQGSGIVNIGTGTFTSRNGTLNAGNVNATYGVSVSTLQVSSNTILGAATYYANGYFVTGSTVNANNWLGGGLSSSIGSASTALGWSATTGQFNTATITAAGIGALTANQSITLSGDASGTGTTAITVTNAASQPNIKTLTSSVTVNNTSGLLVVGPVIAGVGGYTVTNTSNTILPGTTFYNGGLVVGSTITFSSGTINTLNTNVLNSYQNATNTIGLASYQNSTTISSPIFTYIGNPALAGSFGGTEYGIAVSSGTGTGANAPQVSQNISGANLLIPGFFSFNTNDGANNVRMLTISTTNISAIGGVFYSTYPKTQELVVMSTNNVSVFSVSNSSVTAGDYMLAISSFTGSSQTQNVMTVNTSGVVGIYNGNVFSNLGTPANGTYEYCSDCTVTTAATCTANLLSSCVCAGSGSGAFARRINSTWYCQ